MTYVTVRADVEVDLKDIDTDDLCEELESRGLKVIDTGAPNNITSQTGEELGGDIGELYYAYTSKSPTFNSLLVNFFDKSIGRIA